MKISIIVLTLLISSFSHGFPISDIYGCHKTLTNDSFKAKKSEFFIEHITPDTSSFLFDLDRQALPVLDFILGSYQVAIDAHHGDWVVEKIVNINSTTLQINAKQDILVNLRSGRGYQNSHIEQKLQIKKMGKNKFKIKSDQTIRYGKIPDRSQHTWVTKKVACPF